jgi:hypothetical protein
MPFALFEENARLTRVFATEQEAWDAAEGAGLVEIGPDGTKFLEDHLEIRPCTADCQDSTDAGSDVIM